MDETAPLSAADFTIELGRANTLEPCPCCGHNTRLVRGFVYRDDIARAVYLVRWMVGADHDADVVVAVGGWCAADPSPRRQVSLSLRQLENGPSFMVVDADHSRWDDSANLGQCLPRQAVVGTPLAREVFAILDAIADQDGRLARWNLRAADAAE